MKSKLLPLLLIPLLIFVISCNNEHNYTMNKRYLLKNVWKINTYVDYEQNSTIEMRKFKYIFNNNGTLYKIYENNDTVNAIWQLDKDGTYLQIGRDTFRITELTNRVMSLRHGGVEMFFVSD